MKKLFLSVLFFMIAHSTTVGQSKAGPFSMLELEKILALEGSQLESYFQSNGFSSGSHGYEYNKNGETTIINPDRHFVGEEGLLTVLSTSQERYNKIKTSMAVAGYKLTGNSSYSEEYRSTSNSNKVTFKISSGMRTISFNCPNLDNLKRSNSQTPPVAESSTEAVGNVREVGEKGLASPRVAAESPDENIRIIYGQPSKKGRTLFGDENSDSLEKYGKVWRTGANEATEVTFKNDVMFGGKVVKAGTYTLFTVPGATEWGIILNSTLSQWGAFDYDSIKNKDVLNVKVLVINGGASVEKLAIFPTNNNLTIAWGQTKIVIPVKSLK